MKAAQFYNKGDIRVVEVPEPEPKDHEVLIAIEWGGICGSDLHEYLHDLHPKGPLGIPTSSQPHPLTEDFLPVTMGHEMSGRILSAPAGSHLVPGQAVVVDPRIYCGNCAPCSSGTTECCTGPLGFKGLSTGGGFADTVAIDAKLCYPLPESVDLSLAALIEPLAVAWHAVALCEVANWSNKSVLILGGGPVGIAHCHVLRSLGCESIYVSEPTATRADQNQNLADAVFNPFQDNIGDKCREYTAGAGVDVVFDCAGIQKGFAAGMDALRYRGVYMNVATWVASMSVPFTEFLFKEITIKCSLAYDDVHFKETVDAFVAGKFKGVEAMVTSRIHLDDISKKGFDELTKNKDEHIKILVTPKASNIPQ